MHKYEVSAVVPSSREEETGEGGKREVNGQTTILLGVKVLIFHCTVVTTVHYIFFKISRILNILLA